MFQTQDFQQFDYGGGYGGGAGQSDQYSAPSSYLGPGETPYTGAMFIPDSATPPSSHSATAQHSGFEDEPPLLEELGINPDHILQKTLTVLNPMRSTDVSIAKQLSLIYDLQTKYSSTRHSILFS